MSDPTTPLPDEPLPDFDLPSLDEIMPLEDDVAAEDDRGERGVGVAEFKYIGQGLQAAEFAHYVETYDFGAQAPDFIVLHHTGIPSTAAAPSPTGWRWDNGEAGFSEGQVYRKRLKQLEMLREHYRTNLGWDRGPHLFIDDTWIWLFTPMFDQGIHAKEGNGYHDNTGRLRYSIGIEVCGDFTNVPWSPPVAALVGHTVAVLKKKLGNFELKHQKFSGGISSHRDYNKPACPGNAVTNNYYIGVLNDAWNTLNNTPVVRIASSPITTDSPLLGPPSGSREQAVNFVRKTLPANSEYQNDIETILGHYWTYAPSVGIDPFIAASQCIFETGGFTSGWSARPKRNPAGLGVRQEGGLAFETWDESIQAHLGQLLAFALRDDEANDAQKAMMQRNPRHAHIKPELRGSAKTMAGLSNNWTDDAEYASKLVNRVESIRRG